jgi:hypothetical protein
LHKLLIECVLPGKGVTARNRNLIISHVSDSGLFNEVLTMITKNLNETAQKHMVAIIDIWHVIIGAIEADIASMAAPDTAVFEEHPEFGEKVAYMLIGARKSLERLQRSAEQPIAMALQLGYIQ